MKRTIKALSRQLFGAGYGSARRGLLYGMILFLAVYAAGLRLTISARVLYLTSFFFTAGVMWQTLSGRRCMETMLGFLVLPYENRRLVFSYVSAVSSQVLLTKTLPVWALLFALDSWNVWEIIAALLSGGAASLFAAVSWLLWRRRYLMPWQIAVGYLSVPVIWCAALLSIILFVPHPGLVLTAGLMSMGAAAGYFSFTDARDFYRPIPAGKPVCRRKNRGKMSRYLVRYLMRNKNYGINTLGLSALACVLPLWFGSFREIRLIYFGFALLGLNTPLCTLLSADPDLEQAVRTLPGQARRFCGQYTLFLCLINGAVTYVYLCSWQLIHGGIGGMELLAAALFVLQGALGSVLLEWVCPLRNWKTESDLWHHPRKYLIPLLLLVMAALVGANMRILWGWGAFLLVEWSALWYMAGRGNKFPGI